MCVRLFVCVRKRNGEIVCFAICAFDLFATLEDDAVLRLIGLSFHSLHASVSAHGVHCVCVRLKSMWSTYWKVCIHLNILLLVYVQVITELLF